MYTCDDDLQQMKTGSSWPGVLASFFVPGFGLLRAGMARRGVMWFLGIQLCTVLAVFSLVIEVIPIQFAFVVLAVAVVVQFWMWRDSFRPGRMTWRLWVGFFVVLAAMILLPMPAHLVGRGFKIPTSSMQPTLMGINEREGSDLVIVNRLSYLFSKPKRGDLLVFSTSSIRAISNTYREGLEEIYYIKRVIGLPGERIEIKKGSIFADGLKLGVKDGVPPIKYVSWPKSPSSAKRDGEFFIVGEDEFFVLGDNTENSFDSRSWGGVPASNVYGKVTKIYYPLSRIGKPHFPSEIKD